MKIRQTFAVALQSLKTNKLRTLLTILGVVVGIFSIIVVMTVITMLQNSIEDGVSQLAKNTFQIQKFPVIMGGGPGSRDKYRNRKDLTLDDYDDLSKLPGVEFVYKSQALVSRPSLATNDPKYLGRSK